MERWLKTHTLFSWCVYHWLQDSALYIFMFNTKLSKENGQNRRDTRKVCFTCSPLVLYQRCPNAPPKSAMLQKSLSRNLHFRQVKIFSWSGTLLIGSCSHLAVTSTVASSRKGQLVPVKDMASDVSNHSYVCHSNPRFSSG